MTMITPSYLGETIEYSSLHACRSTLEDPTEASLIYVNADAVMESALNHLHKQASSLIRLVVCDLSAAPYLDLAGCRMLHQLHAELSSRDIILRIVGAHGATRDLLRADGVEEKVGGLDRTTTLESVLRDNAAG